MPVDPKKIEEHKAKLGEEKVQLLRAGKYEILVRSPGRPQWKRFMQASGAPEKRADALETLVRDCLLEPAAQDLEAMFDERPALAIVFGDALGELAGASLEVEKNG